MMFSDLGWTGAGPGTPKPTPTDGRPRGPSAAPRGCSLLTDKGSTGSGIGIQVPLRGDKLATGNHARSAMINAPRALPNARTPQTKAPGAHSYASPLTPWRIGAIAAATLVLLQL